MTTRFALPLLISVSAMACATPDVVDLDGGTTGRSTGTAGATGASGATGTGGRITGEAGATGAAGISGASGTGGAAGMTGEAGMTGVSGGGGATSAAGGGGVTGNAGSTGAAGSGGIAGSTGIAGSAGIAGNAGRAGVCAFASGVNVAWVNFGQDIPNPDLASFNLLFQNTHAAGGRVVRWWFHTNGSTTPGYDANGMAQKLPQAHVDGVKSILNAAHTAGVAVNISLWSFDMLQSDAGNAHTNNSALLEKDANRQAYIDNYLTPLVTALRGTPGLYSYEIFNEPEGMAPSGWATYRTTQAAIQKTVNWFAAAIHAADPDVLVTNGSQTFDYCSNAGGKSNWYSDAALRAVGGKQTGTLDFYEVHYYTSNGVTDSPFKNPASHWGLDKKLVMGEFFADTTDGVATNDIYTYLYSNGYSGAWAWQYYDPGKTPSGAAIEWPSMKVAMQNVYNAHQSDVGSCP